MGTVILLILIIFYLMYVNDINVCGGILLGIIGITAYIITHAIGGKNYTGGRASYKDSDNKDNSDNSDNELIEFFDNTLRKTTTPSGDVEYAFYPDAEQKYKSVTTASGYDAILSLYKKVKIILDDISSNITGNVDDAIKRGISIYVNKPSQNASQRITWSDEEYNDLGFKHAYIKFKSLQRFTEIYNALVRMHNKGMLGFLNDVETYKVVSLGGGPGFELYAMKVFINEYYENVTLQMTTIDLSDWSDTNKVFGADFQTGSFYDAKVVDDISNKYDMVIMSYVVKHYFEPFSKKYKLLFDLLKNKDKLLLINSRQKHLRVVRTLSRKYNVAYLVKPKDTRQIVISNMDINDSSNSEGKAIELPFLNVPYEEN